ncbi:MAG TPA: hypothetical protein VER03_12540 [Bryobacteraceae bacterium]|nr:hypothetical protein [Bryobacteraceae bacterium]
MFTVKIPAALSALLVPITLLAQSDRGTLPGTVPDVQSAIIQNAPAVPFTLARSLVPETGSELDEGHPIADPACGTAPVAEI